MAKTRRTRGSGSYDKITDKKGNTLYRWRIGIYNPLDKKTVYKSIKAKSRDLLDEKVTAWKEENETNGMLPSLPKRITIQKWVEIWLQTVEGKLAAGTVYHYKTTIKNHILPNFANQWIGKVSALDLQRYFDMLSEKNAPSTVKSIRAHFCGCFETAVRLGVIAKNPVKQTTLPRKAKPSLKILEESEVLRLLSIAKSGNYCRPPKDDAAVFNLKRNYMIILLAVASGMRQGEILGLTWSCINGDRIEVKHSLQNLPKAHILKEPKNGKRRIVVIPKSVAKELCEWREYQSSYAAKYKGFYENQTSFVFTKSNGGCINGTNFTEWVFRAMLAAAGLVGTRFHDLRHFFASSMLAHGVSVMAVSEQLGHSSINITLERYTHVLERSRDEMKEMLNENPLFKTGEDAGEEPMAENG